LPPSAKPLYYKAKSSIKPDSADSSAISDVIKNNHLEDALPFGEGSLASKIHNLPRTSEFRIHKPNKPLHEFLSSKKFRNRRSSDLHTLPRCSPLSNAQNPRSSFPHHPPPCQPSTHPPSFLHPQPTLLEFNAALLEYLSSSPAKIILKLLQAWAASRGFFKFDREGVLEVLDVLVDGIMDGVAEQTREFLGKGGMRMEKEEILTVLGVLKGVVGGRVRDFLGGR
jgi:hypothetical protein